jgi:hypothetical protein
MFAPKKETNPYKQKHDFGRQPDIHNACYNLGFAPSCSEPRAPLSENSSYAALYPHDCTLGSRKHEADRIRKKYPEQYPIVVLRGKRCTLPPLDKNKFIVSGDMTLAQVRYRFWATCCSHLTQLMLSSCLYASFTT